MSKWVSSKLFVFLPLASKSLYSLFVSKHMTSSPCKRRCNLFLCCVNMDFPTQNHTCYEYHQFVVVRGSIEMAISSIKWSMLLLVFTISSTCSVSFWKIHHYYSCLLSTKNIVFFLFSTGLSSTISTWFLLRLRRIAILWDTLSCQTRFIVCWLLQTNHRPLHHSHVP